MIELADLGHDEAVRGAMEDARRLRKIARTISPDPARLTQSGAALARDIALVMRFDRRAA
jgi:hypothetical protein